MNKKFSLKQLPKLHYNSPVILTYALVALATVILNMVTGGFTNTLLFSVYGHHWLSPLHYFRLFGHVIGHADFAHYMGNFLLIMLVGPPLEEKYGSKKILVFMAITAFLTGLISSIFSPNVALCGASGIAFMFIVLNSFVNVQKGKLPLTLIFAIVYYLGGEILTGVNEAISFTQDGVSQFAHIFGGVCGIVFGIYEVRKRK